MNKTAIIHTISNHNLMAVACSSRFGSGSYFFFFPTWYEFLCVGPNNQPQIQNLSDIWLIVAAVIDILLRVATFLAVIFLIYGGVKFILSQGNPEQTTAARNTILSAVIGLIITIVASVVVGFVAGAIR